VGGSPLLAEGFFSSGLVRYFDGQVAQAEADFNRACESYDQDARYFYFRGLSRLAQGKRNEALADFRQGVRLERLNRPGRAAVNASLERVQGADRQTLNSYRP